ncbi:MAG: hypothetical protein ACSHXL_04705 [Bacteroidota bacterium]
MKGKWQGTYWFSKGIGNNTKPEPTEFEMNIIDFIDGKISGTISDNTDTGGTRGIGTIIGTFKENKFKFIKQMPVRTSIFPDGTKIEENKKHRPIYYEGKFNKSDNSVRGTWKFKRGFGFIKRQFVIYPGTNGMWEMKRV